MKRWPFMDETNLYKENNFDGRLKGNEHVVITVKITECKCIVIKFNNCIGYCNVRNSVY